MLHVMQAVISLMDGFGIKGEHDVACEQAPDWVMGSKGNQEERGAPRAVCLWGGRTRREPIYITGRLDMIHRSSLTITYWVGSLHPSVPMISA